METITAHWFVDNAAYEVAYAPAAASPALPELWRHKDDAELGSVAPERVRYPTPQVYTLRESTVTFTRQWQYYLRAINYNMSLQHAAQIMGSRRAFFNRKGIDDPELPPRRNWIEGKDLDAKDPEMDKVRTCARSVMTGGVSGDSLIVETFNGSYPPPLKPGREYPQRVEDIRLDDYLYTPREHRWLFFAANNVTSDGRTVPFPNGALYDWFENGTRPVTWMPHVSRFEVRYPVANLIAVSGVPSPYRP